jgi:hypothetical protein
MMKARKKTSKKASGHPPVLPVHTNKTLKQLRKTGAFKWTGSTFELLDERKLAEMAGQQTAFSGIRPFI